MAMTVDELRWNEEYRKTRDLIARLSVDQLRAIRTVATEFVKEAGDSDFYRPLTREEMAADMDEALAQVAQGMCRNIEDFGAEVAAEFGFST